MDIKELNILGTNIDQHWYYLSKAKAMMKILSKNNSRKIIDVGAGSGFFSKWLLKNTSAKEAWCVDISYKSDLDKKENNKCIYYRKHIDKIDADLVLFMDVLEHVDDDVALLKNYINKVPKNTKFLITVPAFNFLWSEHDDFLDHKRRYSLGQLEKVVIKSGLVIETEVYFFGFVFPIAAILRFFSKRNKNKRSYKSQLTKHHLVSNFLLKYLCDFELHFMKLNFFAGLSIFCLAKKP